MPEGFCEHTGSFTFDRWEKGIVHVHCADCGASGSVRVLHEEILWPSETPTVDASEVDSDALGPEQGGPIRLVTGSDHCASCVDTIISDVAADAENLLAIGIVGVRKGEVRLAVAHNVRDAHLGDLLLATKMLERNLVDLACEGDGS